MFGVLVNAAAVIFGSLVGYFLRKSISRRLSDAAMIAVGLCVLYIGIDGSLAGENTLVLVVSFVAASLIGTLIDIDGRLLRLNDYTAKKLRLSKEASPINAAVSASLLFCIGSLAIVGPINAGISGDYEILYTKSLIDMISAAMLTVSLGLGVALSAAVVFVYEGIIAALAGFVAPLLPDFVVNEMNCAGCVLIIALGLNLIGVSKLKIANYLPVIIIAPILAWCAGFLGML